MSGNTYLPYSDADQASWLRIFASKLAIHGPTLGITAAEIASVAADSAMLTYILDRAEFFKKELSKLIAYKNALADGEIGSTLGAIPATATIAAAPAAVPAGIFKRISKLVQRIKGHQAYTVAIGEDLGIEGHNNSSKVITNLKPEIKITITAGKPVIKWKKGRMKSADIYVDRGDGKGFVFLVTATAAEYKDNCEIPADTNVCLWHYKAIYRNGNEQAGEFSNIASITVYRQVSGN